MTVVAPVRGCLLGCRHAGKREVQLEAVVAAVELPRRPVLRVFDKLTREEVLVQVAGPTGATSTGRRSAIHAGESPRPPERRRDTARDRIRHLLRSQHRRTRYQLATLAGTSWSNVDQYLAILEREGYVRRVGKDGADVVFLLVRNPGPARPRLPETAEATETRKEAAADEC